MYSVWGLLIAVQEFGTIRPIAGLQFIRWFALWFCIIAVVSALKTELLMGSCGFKHF